VFWFFLYVAFCFYKHKPAAPPESAASRPVGPTNLWVKQEFKNSIDRVPVVLAIKAACAPWWCELLLLLQFSGKVGTRVQALQLEAQTSVLVL
jgi:hypothetical protein